MTEDELMAMNAANAAPPPSTPKTSTTDIAALIKALKSTIAAPTSGMYANPSRLAAYDAAKKAYATQYNKINPYTGNTNPGGGYSQAQMEEMGTANNQSRQDFANDEAYAAARDNAWRASLTPEQRAEYDQIKASQYSKGNSTAKGAMLASIAAMGGLGALGSMSGGTAGALGQGLSGLEGLGGLGQFGSFGGLDGLGSIAGLEGLEGLGGMGALGGISTGGGALEGLAGLGQGLEGLQGLGGLGQFGSFGGLDGLGSIPGLEGLQGLGGTGALGGLGGLGGTSALGGAGSSILDKIKELIGGGLPTSGGSSGQSGGQNTGSGLDWSKLLSGLATGGAGLAAIQALRNKTSLPALPDYLKLAEQTAASRNQAVDQQTMANRPNQTNAMGDTSNWTRDPVTGQWTNKVSFGQQNQQKFDQQSQMAAALRGQIMDQQKNPVAMPGMTGIDPSTFQGINLGALSSGLPPMGALNPKWGG
jgi:hypothetical protein